jgi:hypothetical protein
MVCTKKYHSLGQKRFTAMYCAKYSIDDHATSDVPFIP